MLKEVVSSMQLPISARRTFQHDATTRADTYKCISTGEPAVPATQAGLSNAQALIRAGGPAEPGPAATGSCLELPSQLGL